MEFQKSFDLVKTMLERRLNHARPSRPIEAGQTSRPIEASAGSTSAS